MILHDERVSDQRYHLFALLSLANPADAPHIMPDYKIILEEVFTNFARAMIESGRISLLHDAFRCSNSKIRQAFIYTIIGAIGKSILRPYQIDYFL